MPIPRIAIVGRPNVGKSSLLNMIAGDKVSIVDPTPGTTRDRVSVIVELPSSEGHPPKDAEIVDTGGVGVYVAEGRQFNEVGADLAALSPDIEQQIALAVATADLVLFAVDAQAGITPGDMEIARLLREGRLLHRARLPEGVAPNDKPPPVVVVATKVDGPRWEAHGYEIAGLGFGEPLMCSATSNYLRRDFIDRLHEMIPRTPPEDAGPPVDLRIAIVGKRNAGKSSLVNALAGQERVIVSEIAGTTRDAVDVRIERDGRSMVVIDTAGLRRKKSFADRIEWWAFDRMKRAVARADVVLMLLDGTEKVSQVDEQIATLLAKAWKPVVLVVSKWDLVEGRAGPTGKPATPRAYDEYLRRELGALAFAPLAFVSASTGTNISRTIDLAFEVHRQAGERVSTGKLNRLVRDIIARRNPPSKLGVQAKVLYVSQIRTYPPTIVLVVNRPDIFSLEYQRFLVNRFREELPFPEVPIRLLIRGRRASDRATVETIEPETLDSHEIEELERDATLESERDAEAFFEDDEPGELLQAPGAEEE